MEKILCGDCGSDNVGMPATYDSLIDLAKTRQEQDGHDIADVIAGELKVSRARGEAKPATSDLSHLRESVGLPPSAPFTDLYERVNNLTDEGKP